MSLLRDKTERPVPEWLRPRWEQKKRETANRVAAAVEGLDRENRAVTYASIRENIHALFGVWVSTNTIKRNDLAYAIYIERGKPLRARPKREPALRRLLESIPEGERRAVQSKAARLRREPKDALIAKLILLDQAVERQKRAENTLREEIIRLHQTTAGNP